MRVLLTGNGSFKTPLKTKEDTMLGQKGEEGY